MQDRQPTILFIFGGTGDLAHRKLIPALYNLYLDQYMPEQFLIIGTGRSAFPTPSYRLHVKKGVKEYSRRKKELNKQWSLFSRNIEYLQIDLSSESAYTTLRTKVKKVGKAWQREPNIIYYLSVAPQLAPVIAQKLHAHELANDPKRTRMVFEKPFGHDLQSATELNQTLSCLFDEIQLYRIDHYLGKETVQNILALRFANALFEPVWSHHFIDHVQITAAENVSVENRGSYYEGSGALRDMVQNHLLQMLCMVAMEAPVSFDADEIRNKKVDVLNAIRRIPKDEVHQYAVRGQYRAGWMEGNPMKAYRSEKEVDPNSAVETFAAVKFYVDNWRWRGVPFYVRTGKCLSQKETIITISFKPAPDYAFPEEAGETWRPNRLSISIHPNMDIKLRFQSKAPGPRMSLQPVDMVFNYAGEDQPEAYETLLQDVIEGNQTLFMRADQIEAAWQIITPILELWKARTPIDFPNYAPGTWGPEDAEALIAKEGHHWINGTVA
jgi:glucose-6-phosphate 1-dehydrogenase